MGVAAGCEATPGGGGGLADEPRTGERGPSPEAPSDRASLPDSPAGVLVARALEHHDPQGIWWTRPIALQWNSSRPGGERREARVRIDNARGTLDLQMEFRGHQLELISREDGGRAIVDGSEEIAPDVRRHLRLDREEGLYWRNYFLFLVGLPMKLADPGVRLRPEVERTTFQGREVEAVRAEYQTEDGYPWWDFYFDPGSGELVGTRFFREGPAADGEYIVLEGSAEAGGLRIPRIRRWYTNAEGEHLGTDEVVALEVGPGA